jgi:hypothetical protein
VQPVTFRVRSLTAEQDGTVWLGGSRGTVMALAALDLLR